MTHMIHNAHIIHLSAGVLKMLEGFDHDLPYGKDHQA